MLEAAGATLLSTSLVPVLRRPATAIVRLDPARARIDRFAGEFGYQVRAFSGDGGHALQAGLGYPQTIAVTRSGDVYVAEDAFGAKPQSTAAVVRRIDRRSGRIGTVAGTGTPGFAFASPGRWVRTADPNEPSARSAYLGIVMGLAVDGDDNLMIASSDPAGHGVIRRLDTRSGQLSPVAGSEQGTDADGRPALSALITGPIGMVLDQNSLVFADFGAHRMRRIDLVTGLITSVGGTGMTFRSERERPDPVKGRVFEFSVTDVSDGGQATDAVLFHPWGLAIDSARSLFVTEYGGHRVRRVDVDGRISTIAGNGLPGFSGDGGPAISARLNHPKGIAVDGSGNIFVADSENARIRLITPDGVITTLAGTGKPGHSGDGASARAAQLAAPAGLALSPSGALLVADEGNRLLRLISF